MPTHNKGERTSFIEDALWQAADAVGRSPDRGASYSDVKGFLADADMVAHRAIVGAIQASYPEEDILSEEDDPLKKRAPQRGAQSTVWIVDPICGTTNFVRGIPFYSHSLSVVSHGEVLAAGVFNPALEEMFLSDGTTTRLNGSEVRVSDTLSLSEAVVAVNCNQSDCDLGGEKFVSLHGRFAPPITQRQRIMESANLELAYVACGRLDGYVNPEDKVWDISAGSLLIRTAGGEAEPLEGSFHEPAACTGIVAGNAAIAPALLDRLLS